ncbi:MAG: tetratricopeptide repeat-containing sensor histidine kinase [Candidatus Aminicenantes bacterium]|nr:MAG: tetratricopeptide repeat-containing sensor histidine kinase [Candidatus Aminicenantes bacterium]
MYKTIVISVIMLIFLSLVLFSDNPVEVLEKQLDHSTVSGIKKIQLLTRISELTQDSEPVKAVKYGKEALEILQQLNDPALEVRVLLSLTWANQNIGQYETALEYGHKAKKLALEMGDKQSGGVVSNHIARICHQLGLLDRSLAYALQALKWSEKVKDKQNVAEAYKNVGNVYDKMKNSKLALTYYQKSLEIWENLGDKKGIARLLNNIGMIYNKYGQFWKALEYYQKSLAIVEELNWQMGRGVVLTSIANIYSELGENTRSLEYSLKALAIGKKIGHKRLIAVLLSNIGVDYRKLGQYKRALQYAYQALNIAKEIKNKDIIRNFYEELFYIYEAMKDYKQAFFYFKKYKTTYDEIFSEESQKNISELWTKFKTEKKEKELERQKLIRNFLIVLFLLVLILAGVIFNRYSIKKKAEQRLKESEKKLRAMNISKDKLFSIIAHDLGNPLNSILLSSGYLEKKYQTMAEEEVKEFLHQIYEYTDHLAKLLDNLLQWAVSQLGKLEVEPETLDLNQLTEDTIELMEPSAREKHIHLVSQMNENTFAWADKRMVETIMRNLVSNAVKYSYQEGDVNISSQLNGDFREVSVADTGVGIPADKLNSLFDTYAHNSTRGTAGERGIGLGLVLCKELVEKNRGTIRVENNSNSETFTGTRVIFTLPIDPSTKEENAKPQSFTTD